MGDRQRAAGQTILSVTISIIILTAGFYFISGSLLSSRKASKPLEQKNLAENYAAELIESFFSISGTQLAGYLSAIPAVAGTPAYPLCAHINLLDRVATGGTTVYLNRDPMADLPATSVLENLVDNKYHANRYYQVQVVDAPTLAVNAGACGYYTTAIPGPCGVSGNNYVLCAGERFLVSVGVSYVPAGKTEANVQSIVLTTVLPEA